MRKDSLTTGKVLLTVGKTTTWDPLMRAHKSTWVKARLCLEWHCLHLSIGWGVLGSWKVVSFAGGLCSHEKWAGTPMGTLLKAV